MTIGSLGGEFALIDRIAASAGAAAGLGVGIGDDAAVLTTGGATDLLVTTDLLIEDVHFRLRYGDPYSLGVKAAAVNLSDIAAMGGTPTVAFISLALPRETEVAFIDELYRGLNETLAHYGAAIGGGDTNLSPGPMTINVTQLGAVPAGLAALRSTARSGDAVIVTGALGGAAAGLSVLEEFGREAAETILRDAVRAQLCPEPRIVEALAAVAAGGVTAMMDISDGLVGDLEKLCRASGVGAVVETAKVPIAASVYQAVHWLTGDLLTTALSGGEDYELLLTADPNAAEAVCEAIASTGTAATVIGHITAEAGVRLKDAAGKISAMLGGWDHFAE